MSGSPPAYRGDLMTTDQIKRHDEARAPVEVDGALDPTAILENAQEEAKQILAKARYEAFRMVTDARSEAESILGEAENNASLASAEAENTAQAEEQSVAILAAAKEQAASIVKEAEQSAARLYEESRSSVEQQTASLRERHAALEAKVSATQALLNDLETRLARIAASASPEPEAKPAPRFSLGGETEEDVQAERMATSEPDTPDPLPPAASIELDYSPSVPRPLPVQQPVAAPPTEQRSFYSRRSAKLPSIGATGGQDALSAVRSMRTKMDPTA